MKHAPLLVGTLAILALAGVITYRNPSPGPLSRAHAPLDGGLAACAQCHAKEGMGAGCLGCHTEIAVQQRDQRGYHGKLEGSDRPACARCHPEHHGRGFDVMGAVAWPDRRRDKFRHDHVEYALDGAHDALECTECHNRPFALADFPDRIRRQSYLGLEQGCVSCHKDVHGGSLFPDCAGCHDQQSFKPARRFDHAEHFELLGAHDGADCKGCHLLDSGPTYDKVKGKTCVECHSAVHRTEFEGDCATCHRAGEPEWTAAAAGFTPVQHARTGFALEDPHAKAACAQCHERGASYDLRFPQPARRADDCATCHEDATHRGQFKGRGCLDCHARAHFLPARFDRQRHAESFPLAGAHAGIGCRECHTVIGETRRFVGTPRDCKGCHSDPHSGQFESGCSACHTEKRFVPSGYGLAEHTSFELAGAHSAVACVSCHTREEPDAPRRFAKTGRSCRACHSDPHGGQFVGGKPAQDCTGCHRADAATFLIRPFDHARRTRHPLRGAHAKAACDACHARPKPDAPRRYRDTPTRCASCHTDVHRGQLAPKSCSACHATSGADWRIRAFDHNKTRFPLDKAHAEVACRKCHPGVKQRDGEMVVQFKPVGNQCRNCHEFKTR